MKKVNKKLIFLIIILLIIISILATILINKINKNMKNNYLDIEPSISSEKSEIDMSNLTNSEIAEDGLKVNKSSKIEQGIEFNDVLIKDITIESSGDMAVFNASVENTLGKDIEGYIIYLTFLDNNGEVIDKVETFFPDIPDGETGYISATTPKDIATADDIKIERQMI